MLSKILYWLGAITIFFPLIIIPVPIRSSLLLVLVILIINIFLPPMSTAIQAIFWICGIVQLAFVSNNFLTIIGILIFLFWFISNSYFYYALFKNYKSFSSQYNSKDENKNINNNKFINKVLGIQNNKDKLLFLIETLVEEMDSINDGHIKCKDVLLTRIKYTIDSSTYSFDDKKESELEQIAYQIIYDFSFNLLCSGQFHIYRGWLNEMNESTHLIHVCEACLKWACENKIITENERTEQLNILRENIKNAG